MVLSSLQLPPPLPTASSSLAPPPLTPFSPLAPSSLALPCCLHLPWASRSLALPWCFKLLATPQASKSSGFTLALVSGSQTFRPIAEGLDFIAAFIDQGLPKRSLTDKVGALWRSSNSGWSDEMAHRGNMNTSSIYGTFGRLFPNNFSLWEHLQKNWTTHGLTPFSIDFLFAGHEPDTIVLMVMYMISFVTGLVGNIMALWVLTRRRNRLSGASATRRLLVNLAVCDMMVVCVCMPVNLGHQVYNAWVFGDFLCRAVPFVQAVSVSASVLSLAVISLNRYYSVHSPLHARSFFTARRMICMIAVVWIVSSALCLPLFFMNTTKTLSLLDGLHTVTVCVESWSKVKLRQGYNFLLFCALYGFPVVFNLVICFLTCWKLSRGGTSSISDPNQLALTSSTSRLQTRKRIAKMVFALVLLFTFSWLPLYAVDIWIDSHIPSSPDRHDELSNVEHNWILQSRPFAQWLGLTNSSLNPLCYCFVGNLYRSARRFRESYREKISSVMSLTNKSSMRNSSSKIQQRNSGSSGSSLTILLLTKPVTDYESEHTADPGPEPKKWLSLTRFKSRHQHLSESVCVVYRGME
ncbi:galanin receptor 2a [Chanodichthys erythropterus]|uniref:galanin receptor 2a n=1 Tax=Chanodichthys erythropterus TaxID=933992 RepID=UPI00351DC905